MQSLPRSYRRLIWLIASLPLLLIVLALMYKAGMTFLEGEARSLGESLQWAAGTLTTTGFGRDTSWTNPLMEIFVIVVEFAGVILIFLVFPIFVIPFLEERFESRLPTTLPDLSGHVLIYRYGPAVTSLLDELDRAKVPAVILEEDELTARRLHDRHYRVVLASIEEDDPDLSNLVGARGLVLNGDDHDDAAMALSARYHGYTGPIVALLENPNRRPPLLRAGATHAFTPDHVLAAAIAARASNLISPRLSTAHHLGEHLEVAELRIQSASPLAGVTIADASIREKTGATIVGWWAGGSLIRQPKLDSRIEPGTIIVAVGSKAAIGRLSALTTPVPRKGPFVVLGHTHVGSKVVEFLRDAGETVRVVHADETSDIDVVGDPLNPDILKRVGVAEAQAVIVSFDTDSEALFAAAVVRNVAPDVVIIAGANRAENVARIHRAGADFALSVGQVSGQLLAFHLLHRQTVALEAEIKLVATAPGELADHVLDTKAIRRKTDCSVVAVERDGEVLVEFGERFKLRSTDILYLTGTNDTFARYHQTYEG